MATMRQLLDEMVQRKASDLHLMAGERARLRIDGRLVPADASQAPLQAKEALDLTYSVLTEQQKKTFEQTLELDFAFGIAKLARFRANVFRQRGAVSMAVRLIPDTVLSLEALGAPPILTTLARLPRGLVLVTGPTGSGKSTTLAAMVDLINREREGHILTIEDPIEFVHRNRGCLINQREVGADTLSFAAAMRSALREDPDVILVGEMRDLETIQAAITLAETGHLVLATLHTNSAMESMGRIIDVFPAAQQAQIRTQLSFVLEGVVTQTLVPRRRGGRMLACEVLLATPAVRALIRSAREQQILTMMQAGSEAGMQTMSDALARLVLSGEVTRDDAVAALPAPEALLRRLAEADAGGGSAAKRAHRA